MGRRIRTGRTTWRQAMGALLLAAAILAMTSCENLLSALISQDEEYQKQLLGIEEILPGQDRWITGHEVVSIQFEEGVDTSSLTLGGTLGITEADLWVVDWSTNTHTMDTLHLNPERIGGLWPEGSGTAVISVTSNTGKTITAQTLNFDVEYAICVDDDGGADEDGSVNHPFDTIQEGIDEVASVYAPGSGTTIPVRVAQGTYDEDCAVDSSWVADLADRVSLHGGYRTDFTGLSGNDTILENTADIVSGSVDRPASVLHIGAVSGTPLVENLIINPGGTSLSSAYLAGVHIEESNPVLRNITVEGKTAGGPQRVIGMCIYDASPVIENPIIDPGHASGTASSSDGRSYGIFVSQADPTISGTDPSIHKVSAGNGDNNAFAIYYSTNGSGSLTGITIEVPNINPDGGTLPIAAAGIYFDAFGSSGSGPAITDSILSVYNALSTQYPVYERYAISNYPSVFTGNDFRISTSDANCYWDADQLTDPDRRIRANEAQSVDVDFGGTSDKLIGSTFGNFSSTQSLY